MCSKSSPRSPLNRVKKRVGSSGTASQSCRWRLSSGMSTPGRIHSARLGGMRWVLMPALLRMTLVEDIAACGQAWLRGSTRVAAASRRDLA